MSWFLFSCYKTSLIGYLCIEIMYINLKSSDFLTTKNRMELKYVHNFLLLLSVLLRKRQTLLFYHTVRREAFENTVMDGNIRCRRDRGRPKDAGLSKRPKDAGLSKNMVMMGNQCLTSSHMIIINLK